MWKNAAADKLCNGNFYYLEYIQSTKTSKMNLQLFVNDKLVASVPINSSSMTDPFYLPSLKKELEEQYRQLIEESKSQPVFCIEPKSLISRRQKDFSNKDASPSH